MIQLHSILPKLFLIACFAGLSFGLNAQNGSNPFEVPNRQIEETEVPTESTGTDNPFEVNQPNQTTPTQSTPAPSGEGEGNPFDLTPANPIAPSESTPSPSNESEGNPFDLTPANPAASSESTPAASGEGNPFEVQPVAPTPTPTPSTTADNPFDINRISIDSDAREKVAPSPVLQPQKNKIPINNGNFNATLAAFLLIFLAMLVSLYSPVIKQLYKAFLNDNMLKLKHREQGSFLNLSLLLLYFYFFLNAGFFCYLIVEYLEWESNSNARLLLLCVLGITGVFITKHLFLRILGAVFPIQKEIKQYNFTIVVFNIILGMMLLPFNLLIAFGPGELPKYLIFSTLFLVALIYGFRIIRSLLIGSRYISFHKFHFFMYLCTVEIAPTLVLVKLLLFT